MHLFYWNHFKLTVFRFEESKGILCRSIIPCEWHGKRKKSKKTKDTGTAWNWTRSVVLCEALVMLAVSCSKGIVWILLIMQYYYSTISPNDETVKAMQSWQKLKATILLSKTTSLQTASGLANWQIIGLTFPSRAIQCL